MTPIDLIRDASARSEAIRRYAAAYDRWATDEQLLIAEGHFPEAQGAHEYALWSLRAYRAELDDPTVRTIQRDHDDREGAWPE